MELLGANETSAMFWPENLQMEDKRKFVYNLGELLKQTREHVVGCTLSDSNTVIITYRGGATKRVNIECDSYLAIVSDVVKEV